MGVGLPTESILQLMIQKGWVAAGATAEEIAAVYGTILGHVSSATGATTAAGRGVALSAAQVAEGVYTGSALEAGVINVMKGALDVSHLAQKSRWVNVLRVLPAVEAQVLRESGKGVASAAGRSLIRRTLGRRAGTALLGAATGFGVILMVGGLLWTAYDVYKTVQTVRGANTPKQVSQQVPQPARTGGPQSGGPLYVYLLTNISGGSVHVGTESSVKNVAACRFSGGGLCSSDPSKDPKVEYQQKLGPFKTEAEANNAFCKAITGPTRYHPVAHGTLAPIFGGTYWIDTAPSCPDTKA